MRDSLPPHGCPSTLRPVFECWKAGEATGAELQQASWMAMLDYLQEYRYKPLPDPPSAVRDYQQLSEVDQQQWTHEEKAKFYRKHEKFFHQEQQIKRLNLDNRWWLEQLFQWASTQPLPLQILDNIQQVLNSHTQEDVVVVRDE